MTLGGSRSASAAQSPDGGGRQRYYGVYPGIVTNNQDPEGQGRVRVMLPWLTEDHESNWARVASPMTGSEWGMQFIPEVDCEVLVAFERGDIDHPYVIGSLWNGQDRPALTNDDGSNNLRQIKSRSGHIIIFDDTSGSEKLVIRDKSGNQEITLDAVNNKIMLKSGGDVTMEITGNTEITGTGNLTLSSSGNIEISASGSLALEGSASVDISASGTVSVSGAQVNLN